IISNLQVSAGVLGLPRLPASREFLDLRIELLRQYDLERDVLVAMRFVAARRALASQAQHGAGVRAFGYRHANRSRGRGNVELCPEHCFRQANRQFEVDVVTLAAEELVRLDLDFHQRVAGRPAAESRAALPAQPQNLLVLGTSRNDDVERAAIGQSDALGWAVERAQKSPGR